MLLDLSTDVVSAHLLICENALQDTTGALSLIRMLDVFSNNKPITEPVEIQMCLVALVKFDGTKLARDHSGFITLINAKGESGQVVSDIMFRSSEARAAISGAPYGFSVIARLKILADRVGLYQFELWVDGQLITRERFVLAVNAL